MPTQVSDSRSNPNDQIAHAVKVIGKSGDRLAVFQGIYHGKARRKTPEDIARHTGLNRKRVLEEAIKLVKQHIVAKDKDPKRGLVYEMDTFYHANRDVIVRFVNDPRKLEGLPTKVNPKRAASGTVKLVIEHRRIRARMITVDDLDSFANVRRSAMSGTKPASEARFKAGMAKILGESGVFKDWGGERNDLYTTKMRMKGKRVAAAFAFKGPATSGVLTPKKMGKNGDQIQRLFQTPAALFMVQYWGVIDQSVIEQLQLFAQVKSIHDGKDIWFGIIDASDSARVVGAYGEHFK